ncbi:MAG: DUF4870 domain-containing protein, partial [Terrabacter sp.]|nr:DUF4870 domain-containing protein [Terrabacter sp.]
MTDQPEQPQFPQQDPQPAQGILAEDRTVAILAHLSAIIAAVVSAGWLSILGPLVVWFVYKDKSLFVRQAAAGAFNFNLTIWVAVVAGW